MINTVSCPECALPAIVKDRFSAESTDGPIEHLRIRCIAGHAFLLPTYLLVSRAASIPA